MNALRVLVLVLNGIALLSASPISQSPNHRYPYKSSAVKRQAGGYGNIPDSASSAGASPAPAAPAAPQFDARSGSSSSQYSAGGSPKSDLGSGFEHGGAASNGGSSFSAGGDSGSFSASSGSPSTFSASASQSAGGSPSTFSSSSPSASTTQAGGSQFGGSFSGSSQSAFGASGSGQSGSSSFGGDQGRSGFGQNPSGLPGGNRNVRCNRVPSSSGGQDAYKFQCEIIRKEDITLKYEHILWLTGAKGGSAPPVEIVVPNYRVEEIIKAGFKGGASGGGKQPINILLQRPEKTVAAEIDQAPTAGSIEPEINIQYEPATKTQVHYPNDQAYRPLSGPILPPAGPGGNNNY